MAKRCLLTIARQELTRALHCPYGRSERILLGEAGLTRMSVLALRPVEGLVELLDRPWTVQVLAGRVRVRHDVSVSIGFPGDLITGRTGAAMSADADSAVLLTLAPDWTSWVSQERHAS